MSRLDPAGMGARLVELTLLEAFEAGPPPALCASTSRRTAQTASGMFKVDDKVTGRIRLGSGLLGMLDAATGDPYIAREVMAEYTLQRVVTPAGPVRNFKSATYDIYIYEL